MSELPIVDEDRMIQGLSADGEPMAIKCLGNAQIQSGDRLVNAVVVDQTTGELSTVLVKLYSIAPMDHSWYGYNNYRFYDTGWMTPIVETLYYPWSDDAYWYSRGGRAPEEIEAGRDYYIPTWGSLSLSYHETLSKNMRRWRLTTGYTPAVFSGSIAFEAWAEIADDDDNVLLRSMIAHADYEFVGLEADYDTHYVTTQLYPAGGLSRTTALASGTPQKIRLYNKATLSGFSPISERLYSDVSYRTYMVCPVQVPSDDSAATKRQRLIQVTTADNKSAAYPIGYLPAPPNGEGYISPEQHTGTYASGSGTKTVATSWTEFDEPIEWNYLPESYSNSKNMCIWTTDNGSPGDLTLTMDGQNPSQSMTYQQSLVLEIGNSTDAAVWSSNILTLSVLEAVQWLSSGTRSFNIVSKIVQDKGAFSEAGNYDLNDIYDDMTHYRWVINAALLGTYPGTVTYDLNLTSTLRLKFYGRCKV